MKIVITRGIRKTAKLLANETSKAKQIDWGMTKSFYIDRGIEETCQKAVKRGVDERLLGPVHKKTLPVAKRYLALGVKVRSIPLEEFKFGVKDDILTRFWVGKGESIFCVWIYDKKINRQFREMYEKIWEKAQEY